MLVGVSFGRVNGEMDFGAYFTVLPVKPRKKPLPASLSQSGQPMRKDL